MDIQTTSLRTDQRLKGQATGSRNRPQALRTVAGSPDRSSALGTSQLLKGQVVRALKRLLWTVWGDPKSGVNS